MLNPLPAHYRALVSQYEKGLAIVNHAGHVRIGRLHTPSRTLWRTLRHAGFLTMFSFTVEVLEAVIYNLEGSNNNNFNYDNIFKENPLLAEVIEKCFNLESTEGMLRVINRTLLDVYKGADPKFKSSSDFETILKRTMINLDKDPNHKFTYIKGLCESLRCSKIKKRAKLVTLEKEIKSIGTENLPVKRKKNVNRSNKKQKSDIIDLDKYEELSTINLEHNDIDNESPIVIDDEKENHTAIEDGDSFIEINIDRLSPHQNLNYTSQENSEDANEISGAINNKETLETHITNIEYTQQSCSAVDNSDYVPKRCADNYFGKFRKKITSDTEQSPEKLLVPQKVANIDFSIEGVTTCIELEKIKNIEKEIARYKDIITNLDEEEVTDDSLSSPYVRSEKFKEKIVALYKELCTLTGSDAIRRREVTLTVIEGHPPGPVKSLERFLNRNIGRDGNPPFPDFIDVVKCVETANVNDKLGWNKNQVMREARALFTHCGRALQKRRQKREWRDLLSRVKAEECDGDPADDDPNLQARLEANKRVAIKKEHDLLERYSMMQNLPPNLTETKQKVADDVASVKSLSENSSDEFNSLHANPDNNKLMAQIRVNKTNQLDTNKIMNFNSNSLSKESKCNNEMDRNKYNNLEHNECLVMPQIIAESITNKSFTDDSEKIIDPTEISNVKSNFERNIAANFESNVRDDNFKSKISNICFESNSKDGNFQNVSNGERLNLDSNVEDNLNSDQIENGAVKIENDYTNSNIHLTELTVKPEFSAVKIETDPTENIATLLNNLGDNYTVSILEVEDPFFVIEISDSSDEE